MKRFGPSAEAGSCAYVLRHGALAISAILWRLLATRAAPVTHAARRICNNPFCISSIFELLPMPWLPLHQDYIPIHVASSSIPTRRTRSLAQVVARSNIVLGRIWMFPHYTWMTYYLSVMLKAGFADEEERASAIRLLIADAAGPRLSPRCSDIAKGLYGGDTPFSCTRRGTFCQTHGL